VGNEVLRLAAFRHAFLELENRIGLFVSLPLRQLDRMKLQDHLDEIGSRSSAAVGSGIR
jgi:arsenate reductase